MLASGGGSRNDEVDGRAKEMEDEVSDDSEEAAATVQTDLAEAVAVAESDDNLPALPLEVWEWIARTSPAAWIQLAMAIPDFGRHTLREDTQRRAKRHFTRTHVELLDKDAEPLTVGITRVKFPAMMIARRLPNRELYVAVDSEPCQVQTIPSVRDWSQAYEYQWWWRDGKMYREGGRPQMLRRRLNGSVEREEWYHPTMQTLDRRIVYGEDGQTAEHCWFLHRKLHRIHLPSYVKEKNGVVEEEQYRLLGELQRRVLYHTDYVEDMYYQQKLHRDDGPAYIKTDRATGKLLRSQWCNMGVPHREDGPADEIHHGDGSLLRLWIRHGSMHREDGPAYVKRELDGSLDERWFLRSQIRRTHGLPARVVRYPNGELKQKVWYDSGGDVTLIRHYDEHGCTQQLANGISESEMAALLQADEYYERAEKERLATEAETEATAQAEGDGEGEDGETGGETGGAGGETGGAEGAGGAGGAGGDE